MSIHSQLLYDQSTSHARIPAGGIHLIASIDSASEAQFTASFFGSTKALHGENAIPSAETTTHNHSNQQYSITAITTSAGSIAERYAYSAYGEPTICDASGTPLSTQTSTLNARHLFTGREWDATVGLHHFRARWMSGLTGRFLARDPIGYDDGLGMYTFVHSRPLSMLDSLGLQTEHAPVADTPIKVPGQIDIPAIGPVTINVHMSSANCKKPGDCIVECGKPEDSCMFFFIAVLSPKSVSFHTSHSNSGKCSSDINRAPKSSISVKFKDGSSCTLTDSSYDDDGNLKQPIPAGCSGKIDTTQPGNVGGGRGSSVKFTGDIKSIDYNVTLQTWCGCGSSFPDDSKGEKYVDWGPSSGSAKY